MLRYTLTKTLVAALALLPVHAAFADHGHDTLSTTTLPTVVVSGQRTGSLTAPSVNEQEQRLHDTAGSVGFVDSEDYQNRYVSTLRDVLGNSPGVYVQTRYGQEVRLSVRGSGLARGSHTRGILLLQDGIPTNLADGSGDAYQIDPLSLRSTEIYKGGNGLAYGASSLGGAINFVTPTAYTALSPALIRVEGANYGNVRVSGQASSVFGKADAIITATLAHSDGYREHSRGDYGQFNGNVGYRISNTVETRFYAAMFSVNQLIPGALTLTQAQNNPQQASANAKNLDQARDTRTQRIANRTSIKLDHGQIDFDSWFIHKTLHHPISFVLDNSGDTYGFAPRYSGELNLFGLRNDLYAGLQYFGGKNDAQRYANLGNATRGALTQDTTSTANNYEAYFENRLFFTDKIALMTGAKVFSNERDFDSYLPVKEANKTYKGVNPKLGVLWLPQKNVQVFADITRSQDVPDFSDLTQSQPNNPVDVFVPLKTQKAWTAEIGTRGEIEGFSWDLTVYRAELRDEMLQYTVTPDIPATTYNADRTRHQGIELGFEYIAVRDNFVAGDHITLKQMWTLNDFAFRHDDNYGNNKIAGAPRNVLRSSIAYTQPSGFYFTPTLDWMPQGAWADNANKTRIKGYALLGLQVGKEWNNGLTLFVDARNLANQRYISDVSTVLLANPNSAIYAPGEGRNAYAGLRYAF